MSNAPEVPRAQNMDRGRVQQSVPRECLLIPLRWAQHIGCKDEERAKELSKKYFAMELGFNKYKSEIQEFTDALSTVDKGNIKKSHWISQPPDLEDDGAFYEVGKTQPFYEIALSKALQNTPAVRVLEDNINNCSLCKIEIKQLIKVMKWHQGNRSQRSITEKSENVAIKDLRQYCLGNLESLKGLFIVRGKLEEQLTKMKGTCSLELPPTSEIEMVIDHPEKLKSYVVAHKIKLPDGWTNVDSADKKNLLRISSEIVHEYRQHLHKARQTVYDMVKLRQQSFSKVSDLSTTEDDLLSEMRIWCTKDWQFQNLFIKWRGMRLVQDRLKNTVDKYTRKFSLVIKESEEERYFNNEEFIFKIGERNIIECPEKWKKRTTNHDYNRVIEDMKKQYLSMQEVAKQMVHSLNSQRKTRESLQQCHHKWKGLALIHRVLSKKDKMMSQLEATLTTTSEEEYYVDNEEYILQYAERNKDKEQLLNKWPLDAIRSDVEYQRTLDDMQTTCNQLMTQNKILADGIYVKRKGMEMRGRGSNGTETDHEKDRKELREKLEHWLDEYKKIKEEYEREKHAMEDERHRWAKKDAENIEQIAELDRKCDIFKQESCELSSSHKSRERKDNRNLARSQELERYKRQLQDKQKKIDCLELQKQTAEKHVQDLETEKESLLTRLSKIAGAKLTKGNAAITDLSDENRPMKIAEKYSELYDNEWTDALEELLHNGATDDQGIVILLEIVTKAYEFCCKVSQRYEDGILQSVTCFPVLSSVTSMNSIAQSTKQEPITCDSPESCVSPASYQPSECGQSPKSKSPMVVQLTEEQKQTLGDLKKDLLLKLSHAVEQQYGGILNGLLQHYFGKKAFVTQQGKTKTDEREIGAKISRETTEREVCEVSQFEHLDAENDYNETTVLTKRVTESAENSNIHQQQQSCLNKENRNENDVERLHLQENKPPLPGEEAGVQHQGDLEDWTHIDYPNPIDSSGTTDFTEQKLPITKPDAKTKTDEGMVTEEVTSLNCSFIKTKSFANKCVNLCWMMRMKDPPLHMIYDIKPGSRMDTDTFKHYTQSGTFVSFIVWPALRLHKDGALLAKGVAQPMTKAKEPKKDLAQPTKKAKASG